MRISFKSIHNKLKRAKKISNFNLKNVQQYENFGDSIDCSWS